MDRQEVEIPRRGAARAPDRIHRGQLAALALLALLALWPMRDALVQGGVAGAGPDVVSTLWGWWWAGVASARELLGGITREVNHPYGARGAVLSPLTALCWNLLEPVAGPGRAAVLTCWAQVVATAAATAALARTSGARGWGCVAAAAVVLASRVMFFGTGEGSAVAVAAVPIPVGLLAWMRVERSERWMAWALVAALCTGLAAAENPYLAPVLPAAGCLLLARAAVLRRRRAVAAHLLALVVGSALVLAVAWVYGRAASPGYPRFVAGETLRIAGRGWTVTDLPWARARPAELLDPLSAPRWTLSVDTGHLAGGGRYLGLAGLLLAGLGAISRARRTAGFTLLAFACLWLALGSSSAWGPGPFLFLNSVMQAVARPLTQPTRFLVPALVALGVLAAHGLDVLARGRRGWMLVALVAADGLAFGGPGLRLPVTRLPSPSCLGALGPGPVLAWPADAREGDAGPSMLLQVAHGRPAAHRGIASWALEGRDVRPLLASAGWSWSRRGRIDLEALRALGYRQVLVDVMADPAGAGRVAGALGEPAAECGRWRVYALDDPPGAP